jgi:hypothetical protein
MTKRGALVLNHDASLIFHVALLRVESSADEWLDTNMFRNTQRLGDIQFVEPRHLDDLVEAMLDSGLSVVWSSYSLTLTNIHGKARDSLSRDSLPSNRSRLRRAHTTLFAPSAAQTINACRRTAT